MPTDRLNAAVTTLPLLLTYSNLQNATDTMLTLACIGVPCGWLSRRRLCPLLAIYDLRNGHRVTVAKTNFGTTIVGTKTPYETAKFVTIDL